MRADRRDPTINALRRMKPAKFLVTLRDSTTKEIPLSTKQNRWEKLLEILEKIPWVSVEAQDVDGKTLGIVESEHDEDEDSEEVVEDYDPVAAATERISKQMMQVMIVTQQETRKGYEATMRGLSDMTRSMVDAVGMLRETYTAAIRIKDMSDLAGGGGDGMAGSNEQVMKMLMMAMQLMNGQQGMKPPPVTINVPPAVKPSTPPKPTASANGVAPKG